MFCSVLPVFRFPQFIVATIAIILFSELKNFRYNEHLRREPLLANDR
jgi:hypothetical protein